MNALIIFVLPPFILLCVLYLIGTVADGLTAWWFGDD